jgi:catechol 2,3-dioxygenase-like lactoylglutathione lyase family enzyme
MKLKNILVVTDNIEKSVEFYKSIFGLEVTLDITGNVMMTGGLVLQDRKIWEECIEKEVAYGHNDAELYFEENDLDLFQEKLDNSSYEIEYVNRMVTHSWGQRVIRIYDLDHHIIEIAESIA